MSITIKQKKGLDLIIKGVSKKYPFIKGWELSKDYQKYQTTLYINLLIDWFEMSEFYDEEVSDFWKKKYEEYGKEQIKSSSLSALLKNHEEDFTIEGPTFNKMYEKNREINNYIKNLYEMLPNEYKFMRVELFTGNDTQVKPEVDQYTQYQ